MCKKMYNKIMAIIIIIIAFAVAITLSFMKQPGLLPFGSFVIRFFDVMLPILAVGALLKYLTCGGCTCYHIDKDICEKKD